TLDDIPQMRDIHRCLDAVELEEWLTTKDKNSRRRLGLNLQAARQQRMVEVGKRDRQNFMGSEDFGEKIRLA
ncbi:hypothetical protein ACSYAD_36035, partial [Acaryochloris marina NIES-2412]|uniref:hypothetical protein n=1 Tax=Acaryochloris marina TaxID=155978 RepID=UPI0040593FC3